MLDHWSAQARLNCPIRALRHVLFDPHRASIGSHLRGLSPDEVRAVIAAASCERDRLLLRVLWATGARISKALALRPVDVQRDSLVLPKRKNPNLTEAGVPAGTRARPDRRAAALGEGAGHRRLRAAVLLAQARRRW